MWKTVLLLFLYVALIVSPVVLVAIWGPQFGNPPLYEIGKRFALMGFMILALQVLLAGRLKWITRHFGFDILIRFHRYMGLFGVLLVVAHPLLLALGGAGWWLFTSTDVRWYIWVAKAVLTLLLLNIVLSLFQGRFRLKFEGWRRYHDILAPVIFILGFLHSRFAGGDFVIVPLQWFWAIMLGLSVAVFIYHRLIRPWRLSRRPYRVVDVQQESETVWTVKLVPPKGEKRYDYLPGPFHFLTFHRGRNLPVEEHHWTISSSPSEMDTISSTIKELGDFTATIGQTKPGDTATAHGAFGRFSYVLHPGEKNLVFIAGGIGITPLMSMLRHMRDTQSTISVVLLYGNRNEEDIVFRQELSEIETGGSPRLKVVHVLSKPREGWSGETGRIDGQKIQQFCGKNLREKAFYLCGPPALVSASIKNLRDLSVADAKIHVEVFAFLG
jgi:predicted ferric reductase